jgi:hypothetical protein
MLSMTEENKNFSAVMQAFVSTIPVEGIRRYFDRWQNHKKAGSGKNRLSKHVNHCNR